MAEQMKDIKRRIRSVSNIRQITNAMELVSTAKMRKTRKKLENTRPYYQSVVESIREILSLARGVKTPLTQVRDIRRKLYIVIAGDRGLAGGYNGNLFRFAQSSMTKESDQLVVVGAKTVEFFQKHGFDVVRQARGISESFTFEDAKEIAEYAIGLYRDKKIDAVELYYTKFESALRQTPTKMTLLPKVDEVPEARRRTELITYEPSPEVMLEYLVEEYISIAIYGALIESSASEQAARRVAMENATDNADEMIEHLSLRYNRARQQNITQELTEIVSGAEALN